ncbi:MAG: hypothetical protein ACI94Y_000842 [Maribacter sp.]|jgi:hypothetical protein
MKNSSLITFTALFLGILFISSCTTTETKTLEQSDILGKWVLKEASRGGKPTSTLQNIYFEFMENGQAKTNFNIETKDQILKYEFKEGAISLTGENNLNIKASKDLDGNLTFDTKLADYKFKLILQRGEEG